MKTQTIKDKIKNLEAEIEMLENQLMRVVGERMERRRIELAETAEKYKESSNAETDYKMLRAAKMYVVARKNFDKTARVISARRQRHLGTTTTM